MSTVRHFIATLGYRGSVALAGAPDGFGQFDAGQGVQKPMELLAHISGVLLFAHSKFAPGSQLQFPTGTWEAEQSRFFAVLSELDRVLSSGAVLKDMTEEQLWHGPLTDAMAHIGQLSMLRRLAGKPVHRVGFVKAPILTGKVDYRGDFS